MLGCVVPPQPNLQSQCRLALRHEAQIESNPINLLVYSPPTHKNNPTLTTQPFKLSNNTKPVRDCLQATICFSINFDYHSIIACKQPPTFFRCNVTFRQWNNTIIPAAYSPPTHTNNPTLTTQPFKLSNKKNLYEAACRRPYVSASTLITILLSPASSLLQFFYVLVSFF